MRGGANAGAVTNILLLADSFLPHAGGSREYYNNIYQRLAKLGKSRVTLLTKKVPGWKEFDQHSSSANFRIRRWGATLKSWKYSELPKGLLPLLHAAWHVLRGPVNSIHAGDLYPQGLVALIFKKLFGVPYLIYCHGEDITQTDRFRYQPMVRNRIFKNAAAIVANSQFARQHLLRIGMVDERIHVITPGVDAARFQPAAANSELLERYKLSGKTVLVTVARLVPRKGHRASIQAFANVCQEFSDAHYLIVGTGPEEERLRRQVEAAGITDRVTFAGFVSGEHLPEIYNLGQIMVMANRQEENGDVEGFGIVFLEANAAGKPVIGGRSGGAVEAICDGRTGFLVNPDNVDEITVAMRRLFSDRDLRQKFGQDGRHRVTADFDWESRAALLQQIDCKIRRETGNLQSRDEGVAPLCEDAGAQR